MKRGRMNVVFGGNVGSEAKGKVSAYLADKYKIDVFAGSMSPNAGHTAIVNGKKVVTHHIPVGVAGRMGDAKNVRVYLGPASVINVDLLCEEVEMLQEVMGLSRQNIMVDARAAVITPDHIEKENKGMLHIGSTAQGVGEARMDKVMRRGVHMGELADERYFPFTIIERTKRHLMSEMGFGNTVLYEMGQGYDLCLEHGLDPVYCTSRIVNPMMAFAEMGIPFVLYGDTYAVIRTYPIRVNNRTGSSGPYPGKELTWKEVRERCNAPHDITEYTTTTKLERRVFELSYDRLRDMIITCNPSYLCPQFVNYVSWDAYGAKGMEELGDDVNLWIAALIMETGRPVDYVGTGPNHHEMVEMGFDCWR